MKKTKLVIIGSGPSGYTAAIYAARAKLNPTLIAGMESGGQLMYTTDLENFPGFPQGIEGPKVMKRFQEQAKRFGTEVVFQHVTAVDFSQRPFKLWTKIPDSIDRSIYIKSKQEAIIEATDQIKQLEPDYSAESVIISTGATARRLGIPGEEKYLGQGVSTCAVCDAAFFQDKKVYVVGGGDSAMEDALALAKFTDDVTVIHRRDKLRASQIMQERVLNNDKISMLWNSNLKEIDGDQTVNQIKVEVDGEIKAFKADGVFIAIGHVPVTSIFTNQIKLDGQGYVVTSRSVSKAGLELAQTRLADSGLIGNPTMTSVPGVFAAGDVVDVRYKQAITAAGMGTEAALDCEAWLTENS